MRSSFLTPSNLKSVSSRVTPFLAWLLVLGGAGAGAAEEVVVDLDELELLLGVRDQRLLHVAHHLPRDQQRRQQLIRKMSIKEFNIVT